MLARVVHLLKTFCFPIFIIVTSVAVQAIGLDDLLEYDRSSIQSDQWWLLLTGHVCHLDWQHLILNNVALLIIWELFYRKVAFFKASIEFIVLGLLISIGIFFLNTHIEWYVGLSGILHGLFVIGIAKEVLQKNWISLLAAVGFVAKIVWEQVFGITTGLLFEEDSVVVDAHLYGAMGGLVFSLMYWQIDKKPE